MGPESDDEPPSIEPWPIPSAPLGQRAAEPPEDDAAALPRVAEPAGLSETLLARRSARKDGREVASLFCFGADGAYVVRCEIHPMKGVSGQQLTRGPYRFATLGEATAFLDEAERALEYLGCHVS